jgi:hypothetical protein
MSEPAFEISFIKESTREKVFRYTIVLILLLNMLRQGYIAYHTSVLENVFLGFFWLIFAIGIVFKREWARFILLYIYRVFFLLGLVALVFILIGKDANYFFSLFFYSEEMKLTSEILVRGIILLLAEFFCMILMLDDKASVVKVIIAGIIFQIIFPAFFFVYLNTLYTDLYVHFFSQLVRFEKVQDVVYQVGTKYYYSEAHEWKVETPDDWYFLTKKDVTHFFDVELDEETEVVLIKLEPSGNLFLVKVNALTHYNPADAYADLEGFRIAMLAKDQKIIEDEVVDEAPYETYKIMTFSEAKQYGRGIFRVITPRLVLDFFIEHYDRAIMLKRSQELKAMIRGLKLY